MLSEEQKNIIKHQDEILDRIGNTVGNIKNNTSAINEELNIHNIKLNNFDKNIDSNISKIGMANKKLKSIYENSTKCDKVTYCFLFLIIFVLFVVLIYVSTS